MSSSHFNPPATDYPRQASIHRLFAAQARRTPEAVALIHEGGTMPYGELDRRANRLAHHLLALGVTSNSSVGVAMDRSDELIVTLLGILKAGAAYVPLDPAYPDSRLRFIVEDTEASLVLTHRGLDQRMALGARRVIRLEEAARAIAGRPETDPGQGAGADALAYVMYTSGSTGRPNGVAVPHRGVVRLVFGTDYVPFDHRQVHFLLASTAFDAATWEIWGALLHGSKLLVTRYAMPSKALFEQHGVSSLFFTTALFNSIVDQYPETLSGVRHVLFGGERVSLPHVRRALEQLPDAQLVHCYGPTESTTFATIYKVPRDLPEGIPTVPIGRPIGNTRVYLLDPRLRSVEIGEEGEMLIAGDGLAHGYVKRPRLTAERYLPDPHRDTTGGRMYRVGDLARYLPSGDIEFVGRVDHQVKVRGFRVEPGEIETALAQHPRVAQCVVLPIEQRRSRILVAYLTVKAGGEISAEALKEYLAADLPAYMLPEAFIILDAMPLNANGKVDRHALPAIGDHNS